ncbi:MAG TPA: helix-turn-helix domain-containing protein [Ilumatobacteraceae bacterium]|nr:helix-turn-helix domain-containing protein [Ilumatobacteraceae bacterium]
MVANRPSSAASSHGTFSATVSAITEAFGDPTRRGIFLLVRDQPGGLTAAQVADHFRVHPNVARHHLDKLAAGGYVEVASDRAQGQGAGRPSKRYRAVVSSDPTASDVDVPVRVDDLLLSLLGRALAMLPKDRVEAMAEDVGSEYGRAIAAGMTGTDPATGQVAGQRSMRAAVHAVADALTAHGFAAHAERGTDQLRIINNNCPFGEVAIDHPVLCAVDRGLVRGMLSALYGSDEVAADVATEHSVAMGDAFCSTTV